MLLYNKSHHYSKIVRILAKSTFVLLELADFLFHISTNETKMQKLFLKKSLRQYSNHHIYINTLYRIIF